MAIQVTDPRNNLLGQLTAVGQQFLANRQEMRRDRMRFDQQQQLMELLNAERAKERQFQGVREDRRLEADLTRLQTEIQGRKDLSEMEQETALASIGAQLEAVRQRTGSAERIAGIEAKSRSDVANIYGDTQKSVAETEAGRDVTLGQIGFNTAVTTQGLRNQGAATIAQIEGNTSLLRQSLANQGALDLSREETGRTQIQARNFLDRINAEGGIQLKLQAAGNKADAQARLDVFNYERVLLQMRNEAQTEQQRQAIDGQLRALETQLGGELESIRAQYQGQGDILRLGSDLSMERTQNLVSLLPDLNAALTPPAPERTSFPELAEVAGRFSSSGLGGQDVPGMISEAWDDPTKLREVLSDINDIPTTRNVATIFDFLGGGDGRQKMRDIVNKRINELEGGRTDTVEARFQMLQLLNAMTQ